MITVGIITCSDKGSIGERVDQSGTMIKEFIEKMNDQVIKYCILPDEKHMLKEEMINMADNLGVNLILTTGGTGFSKRDVTPEATKEVIFKEVPGIPEAMRTYSLTITKRAMLSRATAGIRNNTLIVNLPGSPKAISETLNYIYDSMIHGIEILLGSASECARK